MPWPPAARAHRATRAVTAVADSTADVLQPMVVIGRGLARLAASARAWWGRTPRDRRGPALFLGAACALVVALTPYGPWLALLALVGAAAWQGREQLAEAPAGPDEDQLARLQSLYDALAPCFCAEDDPHPQPLYAPDGSWERAFVSYEFTDGCRIGQLELRYPPYFPDADPEARARVQRVLGTKAGRGREYHFTWDEESNLLRMGVLGALPTAVCVQHFVTAPTETVLGFTDPESVQRTLPVADGEEVRDVPPVVWRTGPRSTEPHLLVLGQPGSGTTTLLRAIALQALEHGEVLVIDGSGAGEYAFLAGREGVLAVETTPSGAAAALEWATHETERRLRAVREGTADPAAPLRPLWILADRPALLSHLAEAEGRPDPQALLEVPLRHGRGAQVTVALADQLDGAGEALSQPVRACTRARVVLGGASSEQVRAVLGEAPECTPPPLGQPGRGYARLGSGPVLRLQVPAAPSPQDPGAPAEQRAAVEALLPRSTVRRPEAEPSGAGG